MADKFKGGELWVANWDSGEDLKVTGVQFFLKAELIATSQLQIDPTNATGPISIPLTEMSEEEANARGVRTLLTVCLLSFSSQPTITRTSIPRFSLMRLRIPSAPYLQPHMY